MTEYVVYFDIYTFEEALCRFRQACESTPYPVHLSYSKGDFTLTFQKPALAPDEMDVHAQNLETL